MTIEEIICICMPAEIVFKVVPYAITFSNMFLCLISQTNTQTEDVLLAIVNLKKFTNYIILETITHKKNMKVISFCLEIIHECFSIPCVIICKYDAVVENIPGFVI